MLDFSGTTKGGSSTLCFGGSIFLHYVLLVHLRSRKERWVAPQTAQSCAVIADRAVQYLTY